MSTQASQLNHLSIPAKKMDLGGKIAALLLLVNQLQVATLNQVMSKAGLAIGTGDNHKIKVANTVQYCVGGIFLNKTTAEVAFTPTTHDIAANATQVKEAAYTVVLDSGGTLTIAASPIAFGSGNAVPVAAPAGKVALGYVRIAVAAGATPFTAGTTTLADGALTVTYVDWMVRPADVNAVIPTITS